MSKSQKPKKVKKEDRNDVLLRDSNGEIINTLAIKTILTNLVPLILAIVDGLRDNKIRLFEKLKLGLQGASTLPSVLDAARSLPDEAWRGDSYSPDEIGDISAHLEALLPDDMKGAAREITLALMSFILQTVATTDAIIDAIQASKQD